MSDKTRILVVDDEPDMVFVMTEILKSRFEVVSAPSGADALERLGRYEPDLILLDVGMPALDGMDTARGIRKDSRFSTTPILFLAGRRDSDTHRAVLLAANEQVVRKPFVPSELMAAVTALVDSSQLLPREKKHSVAELRRLFPDSGGTGAASTGVTRVPAPQREESRPKTLSEQLADVAADPRVRVLVVDDDPDTVEFIRSVLQNEYEVIGTSDSEGAPDKIITYQPDILLLDINMPKLNGFHLSHLIRLNRRLRGARVIFVSSRSDRESVEKAFQLGASEFVEKPFTPEQLRRKILDVTRRADFRRIRKRVDYREVLRREGEVIS